MAPARRTVHLTISGRVQGVWYRGWSMDQARALNLDGWVRNRTDGSVETLVWGDKTTIDALRVRVNEGPQWGRVDRVDVTVETGASERPDGFNIRSDR